MGFTITGIKCKFIEDYGKCNCPKRKNIWSILKPECTLIKDRRAKCPYQTTKD